MKVFVCCFSVICCAAPVGVSLLLSCCHILGCSAICPHVLKPLVTVIHSSAQDFEGIFRAMDGYPVTIRLLDPPLHEFLPQEGPALSRLCEQLATELGSDARTVMARLQGLHEANPMMGLRGCRLGIVHPEITLMQANAIMEAAVNVAKEGVKVHPHIMIPLVGIEDELTNQVKLIREASEKVFQSVGRNVPYKVGTMIEVPRGALRAADLAKTAEFFSFGTNDLTQMTFGISRDDAQVRDNVQGLCGRGDCQSM